MNRTLLLAFLALCSCHCQKSPPAQTDAATDAAADAPPPPSTLAVKNASNSDTTVFAAFGANSEVTASSWSSFCAVTSPLTCSFPLTKGNSKSLPLGGQYTNVTIAFGAAVGCGSTKAEVNINNPKWYDILDVSLVDGWSNNISISTGTVTLGPTLGKTGNEKVVGVFPYGCDICVARQSPPCGISKGTDGCKTGSQYNPDVICQYQGTVIGGGSAVVVTLH